MSGKTPLLILVALMAGTICGLISFIVAISTGVAVNAALSAAGAVFVATTTLIVVIMDVAKMFD
ncbi:hypothetical protein AB0H88_33155 [Nonomuraea sp. NPDC050680]|uniref:hypothetical protein n=1 Tax=Nonomuraea sp. NPDC050680 TaxID=3154630 RepID=UPI0033C814D0